MIDELFFAVRPVGRRLAAAAALPDWQIYLTLAGVTLIIAALVRLMPRYWREPNQKLERVPLYWVWGEALYRGVVVRAVPTMTSLLIAADAMGIYSVVVGRDKVSAVLGWGWFVLFMAVAGVWGSVALFNQPKFVVPPYMRHEPGAASVWLRSRGARRSEVLIWTGVTAVWLVIMAFIFAGGARRIVDLVQGLSH